MNRTQTRRRGLPAQPTVVDPQVRAAAVAVLAALMGSAVLACAAVWSLRWWAGQ